MKKETLNIWILLLAVLFISVLFLAMIRQFLMAIVLAGIFSALFHPLYRHFVKLFGQRRNLASITTIALIVSVVLVPLAALLGIVTAQAIKVSEAVIPWMQRQQRDPGAVFDQLHSLPFFKYIEPYRDVIIQKAGEVVRSISAFLINSLSSFTLETVSLAVTFVILLYCMFFFLMDGQKFLAKVLYYLPLGDHDEHRMLEKFTSVTRATLKGTAVIGILQGGLAGLAFAVAGISSAVFWGTLMAVLSVIPSVGSALVWGPAAIILAATGHVGKGIGLAAFCAVVVGSLDNLLRPMLVGKDTQMHELMIFFGTLGGIVMFGVPGIILGPIIAALFTTIWDIYGITFQDVLPQVEASSAEIGPEDREEESPGGDDAEGS
jgi:predicted PurR-regulated permease PerM